MGAKPVVLGLGDTYNAIERGQVDGHENRIDAAVGYKWYEVAKFFTLTDHIYETGAFYINEKLWQSFSPQEKEIFINAAKEGGAAMTAAGEKVDIEAKKIFADNKVEITQPDKPAFEKALADVYKRFEGRVWPEGLRRAHPHHSPVILAWRARRSACARIFAGARQMSLSEVERLALRLAAIVARVVDIAIMLLVAALLVLVTSQFVDRNYVTLWHDPPEEYVKIGLVWLCFLGFVRASATGETIRITFLHDMMPSGLQRIVDVLLDVLLLVVVIFLAWKCWVMIQTAQMQIILGTVAHAGRAGLRHVRRLRPADPPDFLAPPVRRPWPASHACPAPSVEA